MLITDEMGINTRDAVALLTSAQSVQDALGMDQEGFIRRFSSKWSPESAFGDCKFYFLMAILRFPDQSHS